MAENSNDQAVFSADGPANERPAESDQPTPPFLEHTLDMVTDGTDAAKGKWHIDAFGGCLLESNDYQELLEQFLENVCILAPDLQSGDDFLSDMMFTLRDLGSNVDPTMLLVTVPPRVRYKQGSGEIDSRFVDLVATAMAIKMIHAILSGKRLFVWACNTASIGPYLDRAISVFIPRLSKIMHDSDASGIGQSIIQEGGLRHGRDFLIVDTLRSLANWWQNRKRQERAADAENPEKPKKPAPLYLGTDPMAEEIHYYGFASPTSPEYSHIAHVQPIVQEVIWRVKAAFYSDVSSAMREDKYIYEHFGNDNEMSTVDRHMNRIILLEKIRQLFQILADNNVETIILGCTELPIAWMYAKNHDLLPVDYNPEIINPATLVATDIFSLESENSIKLAPVTQYLDDHGLFKASHEVFNKEFGTSKKPSSEPPEFISVEDSEAVQQFCKLLNISLEKLNYRLQPSTL